MHGGSNERKRKKNFILLYYNILFDSRAFRVHFNGLFSLSGERNGFVYGFFLSSFLRSLRIGIALRVCA